jgi:hypothetical protein
MYVFLFLAEALRSMMLVSRIERNLGYPPTNPFTRMRPSVTEQGRSRPGTKAEQCRSPDLARQDTKMEMPQRPISLMCTP